MTKQAGEPDTVRAQKMLRESLSRMLVRCGLTHRWDLFIVVSLASTSAVFTEAVSSAVIQNAEGVEKMVKFATDKFGDMLRADLTARMLAERAKARH